MEQENNVEIIIDKKKPVKRIVLISIFLGLATVCFIGCCAFFGAILKLMKENEDGAQSAQEALGNGFGIFFLIIFWLAAEIGVGVTSAVTIALSAAFLKKNKPFKGFYIANFIELIIPCLYIIVGMLLFIILWN